MGYGQSTPVAPHVRPRFLPMNYYVEILDILNKKGKLLPCVNLMIHTDIPSDSKVWRPTGKRLAQNIEFGEKILNGDILVNGKDISIYFTVLNFQSIQIISQGDFFETFLDMANSKMLIISRSSLSYLAALFNENEIVWPSGYWHTKLPHWMSSNELGLVTDFKLIPG